MYHTHKMLISGEHKAIVYALGLHEAQVPVRFNLQALMQHYRLGAVIQYNYE